MPSILIEKGNFTMAEVHTNPDGGKETVSAGGWKPDENGGCVIVCAVDTEDKNKQAGDAAIFGDWQAAEYLGRVLELLKPARAVNVPDFKAIFKAARIDGMDMCLYCQSLECPDCYMNPENWEEAENGI